MTQSHLDRLVKIGKLKSETPAVEEFAGLVRAGKARLKDATNKALHEDSRFDLAYNAAHSLSLAALRWHGYRSENRYLVFQCLEHTLGIGAEQWRVLDQAHRLRNLAEYEGQVEIDPALLDALIRVAAEVQRLVSALAPISGKRTKGP